MESSSTVSTLDTSDKTNIKFVVFGVVISIVYTAPVALFLISVVPTSAFLILLSLGNDESIKSVLTILLFGAAVLISVVIVGVIAILSGWAAYRSANESGNIGNAVISTVVSIIVCLIGVFVFSFAGIFIAGVLYAPFATSEESMIGTLPIGVVLGLFIAYIIAVISGALTHYFLARRSARHKSVLKSEGGN